MKRSNRTFLTLSLEQVYGAIAFYLGNKQEAEKDVIERRREEEEFIKSQPPLPTELKQKLERARQQALTRPFLSANNAPLAALPYTLR